MKACIICPESSPRFAQLIDELFIQNIYDICFFSGHVLPDGITGCHRSHRSIVKYAKYRNLDMVLILEDDVMFSDVGAFDYFIANIPKTPFDIYTAGVYGQACNYQPDTGRISRLSCTHCYIVHSRFYDKFLQMDESRYIDQEITLHAELMYMCYPMTALQYPGYSTILKKEVNYNTSEWVIYPLYKHFKPANMNNYKHMTTGQVIDEHQFYALEPAMRRFYQLVEDEPKTSDSEETGDDALLTANGGMPLVDDGLSADNGQEEPTEPIELGGGQAGGAGAGGDFDLDTNNDETLKSIEEDAGVQDAVKDVQDISTDTVDTDASEASGW